MSVLVVSFARVRSIGCSGFTHRIVVGLHQLQYRKTETNGDKNLSSRPLPVGQTSYNAHQFFDAPVILLRIELAMAADILRFSPRKESTVTRTGMNIACELLEALGELAMAQERGTSHESLATLGRSVEAAIRRMNEFPDIDSAA